MPRYATYTRLGKTVKRRLLTRAQKKARAAKFRAAMSKEGHIGKTAPTGSNTAPAGIRRLRRGPGRGGPIITPKDDARTYLRQAQRKYMESFGEDRSPDPIHEYMYACMVLAIQALNDTS